MNTRLKIYKTITELRRHEPELCRMLYAMALAIEHGCKVSGRTVTPWPKARQWVTVTLLPDRKDPALNGCDPLAVKNALEQYIRKPEYFHTKLGCWGLMTHIARCDNTRIKVEEIRWDAEKQHYEQQAKKLSSVGGLLGGITAAIDAAKDRRIAELENELSKFKTHPEVSDAKG
ncbi:MAG: hypothetical protein RDU76_06120 [Candidatus Edwardsbacteria bacterium]|nr:hypothetical protein [Candidatus Edwardsbacteria bacterium]